MPVDNPTPGPATSVRPGTSVRPAHGGHGTRREGPRQGAAPSTGRPSRGGGQRPRRRWGALVLGVALAIVGATVMAGGGVLTAGGATLPLGAHGTYTTRGYALVSDPADWRTELFGSIASVELRFAGEGTAPVFGGLADPDEVRQYLDGVGYTAVHKNTGSGNTHSEHAGSAPTAPPTRSTTWSSHATGAGVQTLRWSADVGEQTLVVMNADRSAQVSARILSATATLRPMPGTGGPLLAAGAVLAAVGAALVVVRARRAR